MLSFAFSFSFGVEELGVERGERWAGGGCQFHGHPDGV